MLSVLFEGIKKKEKDSVWFWYGLRAAVLVDNESFMNFISSSNNLGGLLCDIMQVGHLDDQLVVIDIL